MDKISAKDVLNTKVKTYTQTYEKFRELREREKNERNELYKSVIAALAGKYGFEDRIDERGRLYVRGFGRFGFLMLGYEYLSDNAMSLIFAPVKKDGELSSRIPFAAHVSVYGFDKNEPLRFSCTGAKSLLADELVEYLAGMFEVL